MVELVRALKMGDAIEVDYRRDGKPYKVRGFLIPLGLGQGVPSFEGGTGPIRKEIRLIQPDSMGKTKKLEKDKRGL